MLIFWKKRQAKRVESKVEQLANLASFAQEPSTKLFLEPQSGAALAYVAKEFLEMRREQRALEEHWRELQGLVEAITAQQAEVVRVAELRRAEAAEKIRLFREELTDITIAVNGLLVAYESLEGSGDRAEDSEK